MRIFVWHFFHPFFFWVGGWGWVANHANLPICLNDFGDVSVVAGWNMMWRFAQILAHCTSTTAWITIELNEERSVADKTSRVCYCFGAFWDRTFCQSLWYQRGRSWRWGNAYFWEVQIHWQSKEQLAGWVTGGVVDVAGTPRLRLKNTTPFLEEDLEIHRCFIGDEAWNPFPWMTWKFDMKPVNQHHQQRHTFTTTFSNLHWFTSPKPNDSPLCYKPTDLSNLFKGA